MHKMRELSRYQFAGSAVSRRLVLGAAAAVVASPARAEECRIGPPKHAQGPGVWLDMDQVELDAAYDQSIYAPLGGQIRARIASTSEQVRTRLGAPQRLAYGPSEFERLDVYRISDRTAESADIRLFSRRGLAARLGQRQLLSCRNVCPRRRTFRRARFHPDQRRQR